WRIVLRVGEGVLRLLHLLRGLAKRFGSRRRIAAGFFLELLRGVLQLPLLRRFGREILLIGSRGFVAKFFLVFNQLLQSLEQLFHFRELVLGLFGLGFGPGELFEQCAPALFETGESIGLIRRRFLALLAHVVIGAQG